MYTISLYQKENLDIDQFSVQNKQNENLTKFQLTYYFKSSLFTVYTNKSMNLDYVLLNVDC